MAISKDFIFTLAYAVIGFISYFSVDYILLSRILMVVTLLHVLEKLGKGIVIRETTALLYTFTCVFMPVFGYNRFDRNNYFAQLWVRYMFVPEQVYFSFALPAVSFFCLALTWPSHLDKGEELGKIMKNLKDNLGKSKYVGLYIILVGVFIFFTINFAPTSIRYFLTLFFFAAFAGLLYVNFTPGYKLRKFILAGFALFIVILTLRSGMFTLIAYMGATIFSFFFIGKKIGMLKKLIFVSVALFMLLMIQSVKQSYRRVLWTGKAEGNIGVIYGNLIIEEFKNIDNLMTDELFFPLYYRTNQGYNVNLVMRKFPALTPFDQGKKLTIDLLASFIPRFLWEDKPRAGGKENMLYYANYYLRGYSTNVGPLGEAYGSFGPSWGVAYLFFLGLFIRWFYARILLISKKLPAMICWIPVLFYQVVYSGEADSLQIMNSLIKTGIFIFLIYTILPGTFLRKKVFYKQNRKIRQNFEISIN